MSQLTSSILPGPLYSFEEAVSILLNEVPQDADVSEVWVFYLDKEPEVKILSVSLKGDSLPVVYKKSFLDYGPGFVALKWSEKTISKEDMWEFMRDLRGE